MTAQPLTADVHAMVHAIWASNPAMAQDFIDDLDLVELAAELFAHPDVQAALRRILAERIRRFCGVPPYKPARELVAGDVILAGGERLRVEAVDLDDAHDNGWVLVRCAATYATRFRPGELITMALLPADEPVELPEP